MGLLGWLGTAKRRGGGGGQSNPVVHLQHANNCLLCLKFPPLTILPAEPGYAMEFALPPGIMEERWLALCLAQCRSHAIA